MCARLSIRRAGLDGLGQLRRVIDPSPGGTTSYAYRPFGDLASITDAAGNVSGWTHNLRGFVTATSDPDAGTWSYVPNAFGELTSQTDAKGQTVAYEANGNMTSRNGDPIAWASYNLPTAIASGANSSTLTYGAWRNRVKQVAVSAGVTETTIYVAGLLDKVTKGSTVEYRHQIEATPGTVAVYVRKSSASNLIYYLHRDHLGSPELITNGSGAQVVKLSFSAYGERRDVDWDGPISSTHLATAANTTRQGFTDHEHLDSVKLIHLGGRVYDPLIGRFLSRDPFIDGVGSSQGANGYAYVWNNPLTRWDPSGYGGRAEELHVRIDCHEGKCNEVFALEEVVVVARRIRPDPPPMLPPFEFMPGSVPTPVEVPGLGSTGGDGSEPGATKERKPKPTPEEETRQDPRCKQLLPDGSTVNNNVRNLLGRLMSQATGPRSSDAAIFQTYGYWAAQVREGGAWDYKLQHGGTEAVGNFNYGATGAVLFDSSTLLRAAGAVQLITLPAASDGGNPFGSPPYGDQIQDQRDISAGISGGCR